MNLKTEFTEPECEFFRATCNFSQEERAIFDLRVKGYNVVQIMYRLHDEGIWLSQSTIERRLRNIKRKIHKVL